MIPIPRATWSDQQTDELFRSLLGKGFEGYLQDGEQDVPAADGVEAEAGDGLEGLRIFG